MCLLSYVDSIAMAESFNYFSPNIKACIVDEESNYVQFITFRYVGSDSIGSDSVFLFDSRFPLKVSNYERRYIK